MYDGCNPMYQARQRQTCEPCVHRIGTRWQDDGCVQPEDETGQRGVSHIFQILSEDIARNEIWDE